MMWENVTLETILTKCIGITKESKKSIPASSIKVAQDTFAYSKRCLICHKVQTLWRSFQFVTSSLKNIPNMNWEF